MTYRFAASINIECALRAVGIKQNKVATRNPLALRVLIVEDSQPTAETLREWLKAIGGFRVVGTAGSEMDATEWLQHHRGRWDLAILDLMIDGGSGFNLIKRAKESSGMGKAVVFSAYATPVVADKCMQLGAEAAFDKSQADQFLTYLETLKSQELQMSHERPH